MATLFDKIYKSHFICKDEISGLDIIHIDRHLIHEVTSPQAFSGLDAAGRSVANPHLTFAVADHNVSTAPNRLEGEEMEEDSKLSLEAIAENTKKHNITYFDMQDQRQGIVHVVGPEQGITLPGTTIVCGDSHTSTHGAFGSIAFGIGTSEVEHVLSTQTIQLSKPKNMLIQIDGELSENVTSKDLVLYIISKVGAKGGAGYAIEFRGSAISNLSMEARMTICNMSIEFGSQFGLIQPDSVTFAYVKNRPYSPKDKNFDKALKYWKTLHSDSDADFDIIYKFDASQVVPFISWGTSPDQSSPISGYIPKKERYQDIDKVTFEKSASYMGLVEGSNIASLEFDTVFIGSCTNGRIEDMRSVANVAQESGKKVSGNVRAIVVPGSGIVKKQAEDEGLDKILIEAGFEWREPGCSMCLAMNADKLKPQQRCASTSNRNFEGRQGRGGRTHLVSPRTAAMIALNEGKIPATLLQ